MLTVHLITVGKLKEGYLREASAEYAKRLGAFCKLKITELPESRLSDSPSQKEIEQALFSEAKLMLPFMTAKGCYNVSFCIEGRMMSSPEFSETIQKCGVDGFSTLNLIIGSSCGLAPEVKKESHLRFSMSPMTFPHQLARIMALEQLYRGFQIAAGGKYHK